MAKVHVFLSRKLEVSTILRYADTRVDFHNGIYSTSDQGVIDELNEMVMKKHPDIYLPEEDKRIVEEDLNPFLAMKKQIAAEERAKILNEMRAGTLDLGESEQVTGNKGFANSQTVGAAAVGSGTNQQAVGESIGALPVVAAKSVVIHPAINVAPLKN